MNLSTNDSYILGLAIVAVCAGVIMWAMSGRLWPSIQALGALFASDPARLGAVAIEIRDGNRYLRAGIPEAKVYFAPQAPVIISPYANPYSQGGNAPVYQQNYAAAPPAPAGYAPTPYAALPPAATGTIPTPNLFQMAAGGVVQVQVPATPAPPAGVWYMEYHNGLGFTGALTPVTPGSTTPLPAMAVGSTATVRLHAAPGDAGGTVATHTLA